MKKILLIVTVILGIVLMWILNIPIEYLAKDQDYE
jgi:hypothetical protein